MPTEIILGCGVQNR